MAHGIGLYSAHSMTAGGPGFMLPIGGKKTNAGEAPAAPTSVATDASGAAMLETADHTSNQVTS